MHLLPTLVVIVFFMLDDLEAIVRPCSNYFHVEPRPKIADEAWCGKLEIGATRHQVWGLDLSLTFAFDEHHIRVHGRPMMDVQLEREVEYVALNIFNEEKVRFVVRQPGRGGSLDGVQLPQLVKVEVDQQRMCQQQGNYSNGTSTTELYKFDYKLRIPRNVAEKVIATYAGQNFQSCGVVYGHNVTQFDISTLPIVIQKRERWPWLAAVFIHNSYQCTAVLISRSIAVLAAHCFDLYEPEVEAVSLEVLDEKYQLFNYTVHPDYLNDTRNDIAVAILQQPIFKPNFSSICLWHNGMGTTNAAESHETFIGFGKSGMNRIDLMSTLASQNVLQFIEGNSGAALLEWRNRWYLKGISQECINVTCEAHRVTDVVAFGAWLQPYTQIDFDAALNALSPVDDEDDEPNLWLLAVALCTALLIILIVAYCMQRNQRLRPAISEIPLSPMNDDPGIVLTEQKFWRFSHVESTR